MNANLSLLSYYIDMAVLAISSTLIVLKCIGNEDIIPELVKQEDSERGAFGAAPHVGLTLMCRAKEELAPIVVGPTQNKRGCGFLLRQTSERYSFSTPILFIERDEVNSNRPINQERKEIKSQSAKKSKNQLKYSKFKDGKNALATSHENLLAIHVLQ